MQVAENVTVGPGALIGWSLLPEAAQKQVREQLADLARIPPASWPTASVQPLDHLPDRYELKAEELRVFFHRTPSGQITILHLVFQETLDRYFPSSTAPAAT
jgi:hypothetical protein